MPFSFRLTFLQRNIKEFFFTYLYDFNNLYYSFPEIISFEMLLSAKNRI